MLCSLCFIGKTTGEKLLICMMYCKIQIEFCMNVKYVQHSPIHYSPSSHSIVSCIPRRIALTVCYSGWILCKFNESNEKSINFQHLRTVKYCSILVQLISSIIDRNNFFWWIKSSSLVKLENNEEEKKSFYPATSSIACMCRRKLKCARKYLKNYYQ